MKKKVYISPHTETVCHANGLPVMVTMTLIDQSTFMPTVTVSYGPGTGKTPGFGTSIGQW